MNIKREDNPELFDLYLNTYSRQSKKLNISFKKLGREIIKIMRIPQLAKLLKLI
jgi:hypothetical protein